MLSRRHGAVAPLAVGLLAEHLGAGALWVTAMPSVSAFVAFLPAGARGAKGRNSEGSLLAQVGRSTKCEVRGYCPLSEYMLSIEIGKLAMIRPDLIIFDCDGVLVDSELLSCRCLSAALAGYGINLAVDQALDLFLGRSVSAVFEHYEALGRAIPGQFAADLKTGVRAAFLSSLCPIEGVNSVLEDLRIPHCVASSSDVDRVSFSLSLTGLAPHFDSRLYTSQMVKHGKPAPDLFLYAAERMQVDPHRTLVIEDSISGVKAGRAAGMTVWGFVGGSHYQSRDGTAILREAGADRVFERMADFWRTDR